MKSTARILSITELFGEDRKRQLTRELKELRRDVKAEMLYHLRQGLHRAEREYYKEIKPAPSIRKKQVEQNY